ncbi:MAG: carbon dioxide concentrating mechanism protein CcmL [Planctomycetia bacterium]|nr:carbon dioxide concentrating mechanism protein CcmL [Planctomycetia bacterium]
MRIGEVIGTVTLSRRHASLIGGSFRLVVAKSLANLQGTSTEQGEELVVYDDLGAGIGSMIAFSEGVEAAQPFAPNYKPLDAYNAAILDQIEIAH